MPFLNRIKNKSRIGSRSASGNAASIDHTCSNQKETPEQSRPASPAAATPTANRSPKDVSKGGGPLRIITNWSNRDRDLRGSRFSVSPESPESPSCESPLSASASPPLHIPCRDATPKQSALKRYYPLPPNPQTDPLPIDRDALEIRSNHHSAQLARLADRLEHVNEWIERDGLRLDCLMAAAEQQFERDEAKSIEEAEKKIVERARSMLPTRPHTPFQSDNGRGKAPARGIGFGEIAPLSKDETVFADLNVKDIRERILAMKRLRADLGRSINWQWQEHLRIDKKLGVDMTPELIEEPEKPELVHGWRVKGRTWEKDWGRLPFMWEWKNMLARNRFQWDENGARRGLNI